MKIRYFLARQIDRVVSGLSPNIFLFDATPAGAEGSTGAPASGAAATGTAPAAGGTATSTTPASPGSRSTAATTSPASTGTATAGFKTFTTEAEWKAELDRIEKESRRGYVPGHRLTEETKNRQAIEAKLRVMAGLETKTPEEVEAANVRDGFFKMFPEFAFLTKLSPEKLEKLERSLEAGASAEEVVTQHWDNHATRVYNELATSIEDVLGIDKLTDRQFNRMVANFKEFSREMAEKDLPAFKRRYEQADPALLKEFVTQFTEDYVTPARRAAIATVTTRPRVPGGGRTAAITTPAPDLSKIKTPDDAEDIGIQYLRDRGAMPAAS